MFRPSDPGASSLAYEKAGFETAAVLSVLLVPGENALREVALRPGTSQSFVFPDAGVIGAVDGGMGACQGQCGVGFVCTDSGACRATGCESQSCALCSNGRCLTAQCASGPACSPGEVCEGGACVPFECAGVTCPAGRCVNGGTCLPSTCASLGCAPGLVCQAGACLHPLCVGKVFVAGIVGPRADLNQFESLLAANVNGAWTRLNVTALPKVRQLVFSLDGSWLFAVGEDDSLRRSQDGVTWQTVWSGTAISGGLMRSIAVFPNGDLYAAVNGAYQSGLTRVIASTDDGARWSTVAGPVGGFNGTPDLLSVAPPGLMRFFNSNQSAPSRAVQSFDGGVFSDGLPWLLCDARFDR